MGLLDSVGEAGTRWNRVGDLYEVTRRPAGVSTQTVGPVPFIAMEAIPEGGRYEATISLREPHTVRSGTYFERGDLLVARITPSFENGKQALVRQLPREFGYATTEVIPLRPRVPGQDRRLLFFYLLHPEIRQFVAERMEGATGRQRVPPEVLLDLPFPGIPPEEQVRIADVLQVVQQAVLLESRGEKAHAELKRAAICELFTKGLRGELQKDTEIGPMPGSWEVVPLETICLPTDQVDPRSEADRRIRYIDVSSVSSETLSIEKSSEHVLRDAPGRARKRVRAGDVIFATIRPTLSRIARVPEELDDQVCSTAFCVLRADGLGALGAFIYFAVQRPDFIELLGRIETGASYPAVTDRQLKAQVVPLPPEDERGEIVRILETLDRRIALHRRKRALLEELFTSLLHKLMTGEIRVADLDLSALPASAEAVG